MANRMNTRSSSLAPPSPPPPRAANEHNAYDSDASEAASTDAHNATPTPQPTRAMSTASIVEITMDERPATPVPDAAPAKRGKAGKKNKGKKRAAQDTDDDDPFLAADVAHAIAASLGHTTVLDHATGGTSSSSYRLPESPSKRIRTSPGGNTAPAAHQATSTADTPFLTPTVTEATGTAGRPHEVAATAPTSGAPSGAPAHDAAQALATGATAPATFAAVAGGARPSLRQSPLPSPPQ
ncbi:hypothetical protein B0H14DRAFT_3528834 [Mycena olivaceomarginata]|nr:hypothetical protein B0H14DRAFT_3528834 [Mycena olivaceomarginata]